MASKELGLVASVLPRCVANCRASPVLPRTLWPSGQVPSLAWLSGGFVQAHPLSFVSF